MQKDLLTAKMEKCYTTYRIDSWNSRCPICESKNYHALFKGEGSWYVKYRCDDCKTVFA